MNTYRRLITIWVLSVLWGIATPSPALARELVLVGASPINYPVFSLFEVRKIFLGYPVKRQEAVINGIINYTDEKAYQVFLQKLIHLSAKNYERRLLSKTFRTGAPTVSKSDTLSDLKSKLLSDKTKVSVLWRDQLESNDGLIVIQLLLATKID